MTHNTKVQIRFPDAQAVHDQRKAAAREAYPDLLMDALERASKLGFGIVVRDKKFLIVDRNSHSSLNDMQGLTYNYSPDSDAALDMLRWDLGRLEAAEAEANRKWLARQVALAKLSEEERELLGL